jgi:hypothetical protein
MAAPADKSSRAVQITQAHTIELLNKTKRANDAYFALAQYDFNGIGVFAAAAPFDWTDPVGNVYRFSNGAGEILLNGNAYSALSSADKQQFFMYLDKFIVACMKQYDIDYNL